MREGEKRKRKIERESAGPTCSLRVSLPVYIMYTHSTRAIKTNPKLNCYPPNSHLNNGFNSE